MKSTIKASISGIAFTLDNDAYVCLKNYLDRIDAFFSKKEEGREIIDDIEVRIAELFSARIQSPEDVITLAVVNEVIAIVGSVDDLADGEDDTAAPEPKTAPAPKKRLFRDLEHRVIGGVCSGLGNYCGIDRVFVRLAFVVLALLSSLPTLHHIPHHIPFSLNFSGFAILLYILLWIVMPAARTMKEKMTMRKETIAPAATRREDEKAYDRRAHKKDFGQVLGKIIVVFCRIVAGFVLGIIAIVALTLTVALPVGLVTGNVYLGEWGAIDIAAYIRNCTVIPLWLVVVLLTLLVILPLMHIIYLLVKALFRFKTKIRLGHVFAIVWLACLFALVCIGGYIGANDEDFPSRIFTDRAQRAGRNEYSYVEKIPLDSFTRLCVKGNFDVVAHRSDTNYLQIETAERAYPHIHANVLDRQLDIYYENSIGSEYTSTTVEIFNQPLFANPLKIRSTVHIYTTQLAHLQAMTLLWGARFVCADTLRADRFSAHISGAGTADVVVNNRRADFETSGAARLIVAGKTDDCRIDLVGASKLTAAMETHTLQCHISGAGKAQLSGTAAVAGFDVAGAAKMEAGELAVDSMTVKVSGASKIAVRVNKFLDAHASGASKVTYRGNPAVEIHTSGAAKVRKEN